LRDARTFTLALRDEVTNVRLMNDEDASRPFTAKKTEKKKEDWLINMFDTAVRAYMRTHR